MLLQQVRCFVAVARRGSFTAAAEAMHLSQPSLGAHIRQLEQRYGVKLYERHARGARLTASGEAFLAQAEALLAEADRAEAVLRTLGPARPFGLKLGVTPTAEAMLAPELLQHCAASGHPIGLQLVQGLSEDLRLRTEAGEIDAALCYADVPPDGGSGDVVPLYSEHLFLVGPQALGHRRSIPFAELVGVPLMLDRRSQALRRLIENVAAARGLSLQVQEVEPVDVKRALIRRHGGYTIVPYGLFFDEIRQGQMGAVRIANPPLRRTMYLVRRKGLPERPRALLTGWLKEVVRGVVATGDLPWREPRGAWREPRGAWREPRGA
jgi:LysR family transcriptional regulator, nitrogen assimilation regulatory protein